MRSYISPYLLQGRGYQRRGALLKIEFPCGFGYADLHPWEEFGDQSLEQEIQSWKKGMPSRILNRALSLAEQDAFARAKAHPLLEKTSLNHYLILDFFRMDKKALAAIRSQGFDRLKIKVGRQPSQELFQFKKLASSLKPFKLRLDFNRYLTEPSFNEYIKQLENLIQLIDYIEDPFAFNKESWKESMKANHLRYALDWNSEEGIGLPESAPVLVLKGGRQDPTPFQKAVKAGQEVIVTSSLDHPLGQVAAAYVASQFPAQVTGLFSHTVYEATPFSRLIDTNTAFLKTPPGTGFGFDDELKKLSWDLVHS